MTAKIINIELQNWVFQNLLNTRNLSRTGLVTGIIGALLVALNIGQSELGYSMFILSSVSWIAYGIETKQRDLLILNFVFLIINIIGLINA